MNTHTETVLVTDDEEEILSIKDQFFRQGIESSIGISSNSDIYGPGILNAGTPLIHGRYELLVSPADAPRCRNLLFGAEVPQDSRSETDSGTEGRSLKKWILLLLTLGIAAGTLIFALIRY